MPRSPLPSGVPLIITQDQSQNKAKYPYTNGHPGLDLRSPLGEDWFACVPGVVHILNRYPWQYGPTGTKLGDLGYRGYGAVIALDWGQADGTFIRFVHGHSRNRRLELDGQHVGEGRFLGESGNTGTSTAAHLHFEPRHYYYGAPFYDGTLKLTYNVIDPKVLFRNWGLKFKYA